MFDPRRCHAGNVRARTPAELNRRKIRIPIIFITGQRDETLRSRLIEQGAIACLIKPFSDAAMLEALNSAFQVK